MKRRKKKKRKERDSRDVVIYAIADLLFFFPPRSFWFDQDEFGLLIFSKLCANNVLSSRGNKTAEDEERECSIDSFLEEIVHRDKVGRRVGLKVFHLPLLLFFLPLFGILICLRRKKILL